MITKTASRETGQVMVLFALMIIAFIAILALVLDGGLAYASRRKAQNAADAGALAGATMLCKEESETIAEEVAISYAENNNLASFAEAQAKLNSTEASVIVTATVDYKTTFASVLGFEEGEAVAVANAACLPVCGASDVVPIAWSCNPPVLDADGNPAGDSDDCAISYGDTYIIMDSDKLPSDLICQDPPNSGLPLGALDCDLDDDKIDDVAFGGNRSWLYLGEGDRISVWMEFGYDGYLYPHTWFAGKPGGDVATFYAAETRIGDVLSIPVYDSYCEKGDPRNYSECTSLIHENDIFEQMVRDQASYHVITFASFTITCVEGGAANVDCPARNVLEQKYLELTGKNLSPSIKSIEGKFIEDSAPTFAGCPVRLDTTDAGAWTVNLLP